MTPRPCNCCGLTTHAKSGTCPTCTRSANWTPAYEDGLYGGHWERDGLTVRWVQVWPDGGPLRTRKSA